MRGFVWRGAASAALIVGLVVAATPVAHAATAHTFTFRLTINGTPPPGDGFSVTWGETGQTFCGPCEGGGRTYVQTTTFPDGVSETFVFVRTFGSVAPGHPGQQFATQTVTADADKTLSASFTYGPSVSTPATGAVLTAAIGGPLAGVGALLVLGTSPWWRRRHRSAPISSS